MNKTVLQIPVDAAVRNEAEQQAFNQGFSSLQEAVRVFLKKLASKAINITFEETEKAVQLSPKAVKRYNKMIDEIESGKAKTYGPFSDADSLVKALHK